MIWCSVPKPFADDALNVLPQLDCQHDIVQGAVISPLRRPGKIQVMRQSAKLMIWRILDQAARQENRTKETAFVDDSGAVHLGAIEA